MPLRSTLVKIAATFSVATACSSSNSGTTIVASDAGEPTDGARPRDAGRPDVGLPEPPCVGCGCNTPASTKGEATPEQACAIVAAPIGDACDGFCGTLPGNDPTYMYYCSVTGDYPAAYQSAQFDGGSIPDSGPDGGSSPDGGLTCPTWTASVVVQCGYSCTGRRTDGIAEPSEAGDALGGLFANRAYLEAVSVHAFARLERELASYGAPNGLLRATRRARREEIRHTALASRLARRFGATTVRLPEAPSEPPIRSLFTIARENAVEGCVRETYGAIMGLVEASTSSDPEVRATSKRIAHDECGHAELAMAVSDWITPLLTERERADVRAAVDDAIADLGERGDARVVALLRDRVWSRSFGAQH